MQQACSTTVRYALCVFINILKQTNFYGIMSCIDLLLICGTKLMSDFC